MAPLDYDGPLPDVAFLERRTYIAVPGKYDAIVRRFEDHTLRFFARHDIAVHTFGVDPAGTGSLEYNVAWRDATHYRAGWASFLDDQEWIAIRERSQLDGPLVTQSLVRILLIPAFATPRPGTQLNSPAPLG